VPGLGTLYLVKTHMPAADMKKRPHASSCLGGRASEESEEEDRGPRKLKEEEEKKAEEEEKRRQKEEGGKGKKEDISFSLPRFRREEGSLLYAGCRLSFHLLLLFIPASLCAALRRQTKLL